MKKQHIKVYENAMVIVLVMDAFSYQYIWLIRIIIKNQVNQTLCRRSLEDVFTLGFVTSCYLNVFEMYFQSLCVCVFV